MWATRNLARSERARWNTLTSPLGAASRRNEAERYTCTSINNAFIVLSIHVAIRTWTFVVASLASRRRGNHGRRDAFRSIVNRRRLVPIPTWWSTTRVVRCFRVASRRAAKASDFPLVCARFIFSPGRSYNRSEVLPWNVPFGCCLHFDHPWRGSSVCSRLDLVKER